MIKLIKVSAGYNGKDILKQLEASFEKGKITSIIGKNGCGKTTLLKAASRQIKLTGGEILIDNKNIKEYDRKELARKISFLPQTRAVNQISTESLVLYGRYPYLSFLKNPSSADRKIAEKAMKDIGILEYKNKNVNELSGGERQKVYIAMVLSQAADIIFLDEPATYLDIRLRLEMLELIKELKHLGKTVVMVLHDISAALCHSDKVCLMDNGRIVICESPQIVYESKEIERIFNVSCEYLSNNSLKGYLFGLK